MNQFPRISSAQSRTLLLVIALMFWCAPKCFGYMFVVHDERLDRALINALVVYGHLMAVHTQKAPLVMDGPGDESSAIFQVERVIQDNRSLNRDYRSVKFSVQSSYKVTCHPDLQDWPEILVPFRDGQHCFLIYGPGGEFRTIVAADASPPDLSSDKSTPGSVAKRVLANALIKEIAREHDPKRLRHLIVQAAPVLSPAEARSTLEPFLNSKDEWVRRAAIASQAFATKDAKDIQRAAADLHSFLSDPAAISRAQRAGQSAYAQLFECYFYLSVDWSEEETAQLPPFLPLFRIALKELKDGEHASGTGPEGKWSFSCSDGGDGRYRHGLDALSRIGTREDLVTLYSYHDDRNVRFRQAALYGISRILHLGLPNYVSGGSDFVKDETRQQQKVKEALGQLHLIPGS